MSRRNNKNHRPNSLTEDEQARLLDACPTLPDLVLIQIALTTGIRRADVVAIRKHDVDLEAGTITFWQEKKDSVHTVPIHHQLMPNLRRYLAMVPKGTQFLFPNTRDQGRPMADKTAYNRLQNALRRAGINKAISFHDLRRTFVKTAFARGLRPEAIAAITDDKLETIQEWYLILDMHEIKAELDKL